VDFIVRIGCPRRHEAHRPAAFGAQAGLLGERIEPGERRLAQPRKPRPQRLVDRVR
jgi:hypothetical protein